MNLYQRKLACRKNNRRPSSFEVVHATVLSEQDGWVTFRDKSGFTYKMPRRGPSHTYYDSQLRAPRFKVKERLKKWDRRLLRAGREVVALVSPAFVGNGIRRAVAYTTNSAWDQVASI